MLTENKITALLADYLCAQQYSGIITLTSILKGIDVTAVSPHGKRICIEVKGATSGALPPESTESRSVRIR